MSIAKRWAKLWDDEKPKDFEASEFRAMVTVEGKLSVERSGRSLVPSDALKFAAWIQKNFGEDRNV